VTGAHQFGLVLSAGHRLSDSWCGCRAASHTTGPHLVAAARRSTAQNRSAPPIASFCTACGRSRTRAKLPPSACAVRMASQLATAYSPPRTYATAASPGKSLIRLACTFAPGWVSCFNGPGPGISSVRSSWVRYAASIGHGSAFNPTISGLVSGDTSAGGGMDGVVHGESDMVAITADDAESYGPAYGLGKEQGGPHCSSSTDFCFFCRFSDAGASASGGSILGDLKDMVRQLASERKEVDAIVDALFEAYEEHAKADVEYVDHDGKVVVAPTWPRRAIKRHLLFSREFEELFDHTIDAVFHSTLFYLNSKMIHRETKMVEPRTHKMFIETVKAYRMWKHAPRRSGGGAGE